MHLLVFRLFTNCFVAPKSFTRRLVVSARPELPTPPQSSPEPSAAVVHQNPPRPRYPPELLKHRFVPIGSLPPPANGDVDMDEDTPQVATVSQKGAEHGEKSKKKRKEKEKEKAEAESPPKKKAKKAKAS